VVDVVDPSDDNRTRFKWFWVGLLSVVPRFPQAGHCERLAAVDFVADRQPLLAAFLEFHVGIGQPRRASLRSNSMIWALVMLAIVPANEKARES
jgi:hypothetical protein